MARRRKVNTDTPSYTFWDLDKDKIVHVERVQTNLEEDYVLFKPHIIEHYAIRWFIKGHGEIIIDHVPYEILPGRIFLVTPNQISIAKADTNTFVDLFVIAFTNDLFDLMDIDKETKAFFAGALSHLVVDLDDELQSIIQAYYTILEYEFKTDHSTLREKQIALLTRSLVTLLVRKATDKQDLSNRKRTYVNLYRNFLQMLEDHFQEKHYVSDYVDLLNIPEKRLNRACKSITHNSASQIIQERIDFEAKKLLYYSSNSIKEIGYHLGFRDPSHFNKFFKKINSLTPGEFRERIISREE